MTGIFAVRAVLGRIGLLLFSFLIALFAAEGLVCLLVAAPPPSSWHQHYYRADAEMGHDITPGFPRTTIPDSILMAARS